MTRYDEERLAELLAAVPAPPAGWVAAAQALPAARRALATLEPELLAGAAAREEATAELEERLRAAGFDADPALVRAVRVALGAD